MNKPVVYKYLEIPRFLQDSKIYWDKIQPGQITYSRVSEMCGLKSRTLAKKVFAGRQRLPRKALPGLSQLFSISPSELNYLEYLCQFETCRTPKESLAIFKKIQTDRAKHIEQKTTDLSPEQLRLLEEWYYIHILYYFDLCEGTSDREDIEKGFKGTLTEGQIEKALGVLCKLDMLEYHEDRWRKKVGIVSLMDNVPRPIVKKFHTMMLERAQQAIYGLPLDKRLLLASTIPIARESLPIMERRINDFFQELDRDFSSSKADCLYQVNLQLFHIASKR